MLKNFFRDLFDPGHLLGALAVGVICFGAAAIVARIVKLWSKRIIQRRQSLVDPTAVSFLQQLLQLACYLIAIIIYARLVPELQRLGDTILASAGLVSLVIGLAAQNTLGNLIAGMALLLYRPFAIGDTLTIVLAPSRETGTVREFTLGYTKLETDDGRWLIVPNSVMASTIFIRTK
jgi:small-conductance mechanosensitive channel